jgi:hypothetical protein
MRPALARLAAATVAAVVGAGGTVGAALACGGPDAKAIQAAMLPTAAATKQTLGREGILRAHGASRAGAAVATYLDLSRAQVRTSLLAGNSLYDLAVTRHRDPAQLVRLIVGVHKTKLDADVASGKLTPARERASLARLTGSIVTAVDGMVTG